MNSAKKVVLSFLNSAEGYFHVKTVVESGVNQPQRGYTDVRDITASDLNLILKTALSVLDKELFLKIPSVALNAALQSTIHSFDDGRFQSKIDSNKYSFLLKALSAEASGGKS